jgi:hypothetical protein
VDKTISLDYIKQHIKKEEKLAGDASLRKYYRLYLSSGDTIIKMVIHPDQKNDYNKVLNTTTFLSSNDIPVPAILSTDEESFTIFQEDAGSRHYFNIHNRLTKQEQINWYLLFTNYISAIQRLTDEFNTRENMEREILDYNRLRWELDYFIDNYYIKMHPDLLIQKEVIALATWMDKIVGSITKYQMTLCHRDYHSKNIMVKDNSAVLIDYQDMRMGPYNYDLVSLLWDSYLDIDPDIIHQCETLFIEKIKAYEISCEEHQLCNRFTAIQRNLKAIGTFAYQYNRGNSSYLVFIGNTFKKVLSHLDYLSESLEIINLLSRAPEL